MTNRIRKRARNERRLRRMTIAGMAVTGALALGGCGGLLMSNYTVSGMDPFYSYQMPRSTYAAAERPADTPQWLKDTTARTYPASFTDDSDDGAYQPAVYRVDSDY